MAHQGLKKLEKRLSRIPYLGGDALSIADISAWSELEQSVYLDVPVWEDRPLIKEWRQKVLNEIPILAEVHAPINKMAKILKEKYKIHARL